MISRIRSRMNLVIQIRYFGPRNLTPVAVDDDHVRKVACPADRRPPCEIDTALRTQTIATT